MELAEASPLAAEPETVSSGDSITFDFSPYTEEIVAAVEAQTEVISKQSELITEQTEAIEFQTLQLQQSSAAICIFLGLIAGIVLIKCLFVGKDD